ncbi:MAG: 30S ribosomal protein S6 [Chlorobiales bacterium]|jgi:small subunit ribosomal protein S6|nr:30S ribosomal protein S6 [Chlorobiales bacterium]
MENRKLYETTVIVNGGLDEETIKATVEKVKEVILSLGCEIKSALDQGRKKLAYKIGKASVGYYVHIEFVSDGVALKEIERQYRLNENIIRFLTIILDKRLLEMRERVLKYGGPMQQAGEEGAADAAVVPDQPVSDVSGS